MPRKPKEKIDEIEEISIEKQVKSNKKTTTKTTKKVASNKVVKKTPSKEKDLPAKTKKAKTTATKTTKAKSENAKTTKTVATKSDSAKKKTTKVKTEKVATKKAKSASSKVAEVKPKKTKTTKSKAKKITKSTNKKSKAKSISKKIEILEYYDLPYRYNETVVKILAQTPTTLFVYWDISDEDKENYINKYGTYFFNNTKPVLVVHNKTKNYSFEVDINDFANSWYLHVSDSNCDYQVELGRRPINHYVEIQNDYLYITTSNDIVTQNDHILFDRLSHIIYFRNVKTNKLIGKDISTFTLLEKIGKFNFIKEFYKKLYPNEVFDFDKLDFRNPSSGNPTSTFK